MRNSSVLEVHLDRFDPTLSLNSTGNKELSQLASKNLELDLVA